MEDFKNVHRELEVLRNSGYSTAELRKDIQQMEEEREVVQQRIQRMKNKVSFLFFLWFDSSKVLGVYNSQYNNLFDYMMPFVG